MTTYGSRLRKPLATSHNLFQEAISPESHIARNTSPANSWDEGLDLLSIEYEADRPTTLIDESTTLEPNLLKSVSFFSKLKSDTSVPEGIPSDDNDRKIPKVDSKLDNNLKSTKDEDIFDFSRISKHSKAPAIFRRKKRTSNKDTLSFGPRKLAKLFPTDGTQPPTHIGMRTSPVSNEDNAVISQKEVLDMPINSFSKVSKEDLSDLFRESELSGADNKSEVLLASRPDIFRITPESENEPTTKSQSQSRKAIMSKASKRVTFAEESFTDTTNSQDANITEESPQPPSNSFNPPPKKVTIGKEAEAWSLLDSLAENSVSNSLQSSKSQVMKVSDNIDPLLDDYGTETDHDEVQFENRESADLDESDTNTDMLSSQLSQSLSESFYNINALDEDQEELKMTKLSTAAEAAPHDVLVSLISSRSRTYGLQRSYLADHENKDGSNDEPDSDIEESFHVPRVPSLQTGLNTSTSTASNVLPQIVHKKVRGINDLRVSSTTKNSDELEFILHGLIYTEDINLKRSALLELSLKIIKSKKLEFQGGKSKILFIEFLRDFEFPQLFYQSIAKEQDPIILFCFGLIMNELITGNGTMPKPLETILQNETNFYFFKTILLNMILDCQLSTLVQCANVKPKISKISKMTLEDLVFEFASQTFYPENQHAGSKKLTNNGKRSKTKKSKDEDPAIKFTQTENLNSFFFAVNILKKINHYNNTRVIPAQYSAVVSSLNYEEGVVTGLFNSTSNWNGLILTKHEKTQDLLAFSNSISLFELANVFLILGQWISLLNFADTELLFIKNADLPVNYDNLQKIHSTSTSKLKSIFAAQKSRLAFHHILKSFRQIIVITSELLSEESLIQCQTHLGSGKKQLTIESRHWEKVLLLSNCCLYIIRLMISLSSNFDKFINLGNGIDAEFEIYHSVFSGQTIDSMINLVYRTKKLQNKNLFCEDTLSEKFDAVFSSIYLFGLGYLVNLVEDEVCVEHFMRTNTLEMLKNLFLGIDLVKQKQASVNALSAGENLRDQEHLVSPSGEGHSTGYLCLLIGLLSIYGKDGSKIHDIFNKQDHKLLIICLNSFIDQIPKDSVNSNDDDVTIPVAVSVFDGIKHQIHLVLQKLAQK